MQAFRTTPSVIAAPLICCLAVVTGGACDHPYAPPKGVNSENGAFLTLHTIVPPQQARYISAGVDVYTNPDACTRENNLGSVDLTNGASTEIVVPARASIGLEAWWMLYRHQATWSGRGC